MSWEGPGSRTIRKPGDLPGRDPTPLNFAEAYVDGSIDLEGDLFEAMTVANSIEELRVPFLARLRMLVTLWRN